MRNQVLGLRRKYAAEHLAPFPQMIDGAKRMLLDEPVDQPAAQPAAPQPSSEAGPLAVGSLLPYVTKQQPPVYPPAAKSMRTSDSSPAIAANASIDA